MTSNAEGQANAQAAATVPPPKATKRAHVAPHKARVAAGKPRSRKNASSAEPRPKSQKAAEQWVTVMNQIPFSNQDLSSESVRFRAIWLIHNPLAACAIPDRGTGLQQETIADSGRSNIRTIRGTRHPIGRTKFVTS